MNSPRFRSEVRSLIQVTWHHQPNLWNPSGFVDNLEESVDAFEQYKYTKCTKLLREALDYVDAFSSSQDAFTLAFQIYAKSIVRGLLQLATDFIIRETGDNPEDWPIDPESTTLTYDSIKEFIFSPQHDSMIKSRAGFLADPTVQQCIIYEDPPSPRYPIGLEEDPNLLVLQHELELAEMQDEWDKIQEEEARKRGKPEPIKVLDFWTEISSDAEWEDITCESYPNPAEMVHDLYITGLFLYLKNEFLDHYGQYDRDNLMCNWKYMYLFLQCEGLPDVAESLLLSSDEFKHTFQRGIISCFDSPKFPYPGYRPAFHHIMSQCFNDGFSIDSLWLAASRADFAARATKHIRPMNTNHLIPEHLFPLHPETSDWDEDDYIDFTNKFLTYTVSCPQDVKYKLKRRKFPPMTNSLF